MFGWHATPLLKAVRLHGFKPLQMPKRVVRGPVCDYMDVNNKQTTPSFLDANFEFANAVDSGVYQRQVPVRNLATACLLYTGVYFCNAIIATSISRLVPQPGA